MRKIYVTTSWDDGHKLDLKLAKLLSKYGLRGTFYIAPNNREFANNELLTSKEILQISRDFEIGAHTLTHPLLPNDIATLLYKLTVKGLTTITGRKYKIPKSINESEAQREILGSKKYLEKLLKRKVTSFCYPAGRHSSKIVKLVERSGFKYARTVDEYDFNYPDNLLLSGTSVHTYRHLHDLIQKFVFSRGNLNVFLTNFDWEKLAKSMFDYVLENGGVYHLWGHSWLVEESGDWEKLESVFAYISNKRGVSYLTNGQLAGLKNSYADK